MKKIISISMMMLLVLFLMPALAQEEPTKGASEQAYEHANENAIFNRTADWFATVGKSGEEKEKILAERKAERAVKQAEKEAKKAQKKAEKEVAKAQKELDDAGKEAQKGLDEEGQKAQKKMGQASKDVEGLMKGQGKGKNK